MDGEAVRTDRRSLAALGLLWALGAGLLAYGSAWGLPSATRQRLLQWCERKDAAWVARLEPVRRERYLKLSTESGARSTSGLRQFAAQFRQPLPPSDPLARYELLRLFTTSSSATDEVSIFRSLRRMADEGRGFDPGQYQYGGAFLYPLAALLLCARGAGLVPTEVEPRHLLEDPAPLRAMYVAARLAEAVAFSLAAALVAWLAWRRTSSRSAALLPWLALVLSPFATYYVRVGKPYGLVCLYVALAASALEAFARTGRARFLVAGAVAGALAASAHPSSGPVLLLPALAAAAAPLPARVRAKLLASCVLLPAALAFCCATPYLFTNPAGVLETVVAHGSGGGEGWGLRVGGAFWHDASSQLVQGAGLALGPLALVGAGLALRSGPGPRRAEALTAVAGVLLCAAFFHRSLRMGMYLLPLHGLLAAGAVAAAQRSGGLWSAMLALVAGGGLAFQGALVAEDLGALRAQLAESSESSMEACLSTAALGGSCVAFDGVVTGALGPTSLVAAPVFGLEPRLFAARDGWAPSELPDHLLLWRPVEDYAWRQGDQYVLVAELGVPETPWHRRLCLASGTVHPAVEWFARAYLYRRRQPASS